jgi:hypothetical protein
MKQLFSLIAISLLCLQLSAQTQSRPEKCGMQTYYNAMAAQDPTFKDRVNAQRASLQAVAEYYKQYQAQAANERTTNTISPVPVIFHILVDSTQFKNLGSTAGIIKRVDSQIAVLNRDFNRQNYDSIYIPSSWKSLYGNVGIHFGLARKDPSGNCSPGYEVKIVSNIGFSDENTAFQNEKASSTGGLDAWDVTKYYNVWCINFTGQASSLLGLTQPKSNNATSPYQGVVILYNTLGSAGPTGIDSGTGTWPSPYYLGRTLTHETGHFFEIWHPWGDDGGQCPTWSSTATVTNTGLSASAGDNGITCTSGVGYDDGLADTPPESDAVYGSPTYTITGGTTNDCCQMHGSTNTQPIGIACLSYMDYTDDGAMHLFTTDQAAAMAGMALVPPGIGVGATGIGAIGENYNLTQNPSLLVPCPNGVQPNPTELRSSLSIYPNPTKGELNLSINSAAETLRDIVVLNIMGQQIITVQGISGKDVYQINLSGLSKGIYFVKCDFESATVVRKIIME